MMGDCYYKYCTCGSSSAVLLYVRCSEGLRRGEQDNCAGEWLVIIGITLNCSKLRVQAWWVTGEVSLRLDFGQ